MNTTMKTTTIACAAFAFIAAAVYALVGTNVIPLPRLGAEEAPVAIFYMAAGCYLVGGLLVLWRRRWLWAVGLAANTWVIFIFFLAYHHEPHMMVSAAGLATKIAQVLLEFGLIYLVVPRRSTAEFAAQPSCRPRARGCPPAISLR
jgi:hypothetical protein